MSSSRALLREVMLAERDLVSFELQGALLEVMNNQVTARIIIAEQRKITRFALGSGMVDRSQLSEGLAADIVLGVGQAVGSIPGLNLSGVGAAFGAAGVLWYGKEMLNSSGFDFAMNLMFCLFSAAAIEPSGVGGTAGSLGKVLKPFVALGEWARSLGKLTFETAARAYRGLSTTSQLLVKGATRAEGPIMTGLTWFEKTILGRVKPIFESIKGMVKGKPGAELFGRIAERVASGATGAFNLIKSGFEALINFGKTALGQTAKVEAGLEAKAAGEAVQAAGIAKSGAQAAEVAARRQGAIQIERLMGRKTGGSLQKYATANALDAQGVFAKIAANDPAALQALRQATDYTGRIPKYLTDSIKVVQKAETEAAAARAAYASSRTANKAAGSRATQAAQTAAARTAAAKAGAARLGAGATKMLGSTSEEEITY